MSKVIVKLYESQRTNQNEASVIIVDIRERPQGGVYDISRLRSTAGWDADNVAELESLVVVALAPLLPLPLWPLVTIPDKGRERVGLRVNERHQRTCDDWVALAVYCASVQWLVVRRDPDCDRAVDALRHDALAYREGKGGGHAASEHLAEVALWTRRGRMCEKSSRYDEDGILLTEGVPEKADELN